MSQYGTAAVPCGLRVRSWILRLSRVMVRPAAVGAGYLAAVDEAVGDDEQAQTVADIVVGIFHRQLRGLDAADAASDARDRVATLKLPVSAVAYEPVFALLLRCGGAFDEPVSGRYGWSLFFSLSGRSCQLRWSKSGIRLNLFGSAEGRNDDEDAAAIAKRLLSAAKSFYVRAVKPRLDPSIASGNAVVVNQFSRYRGMVDFHRRAIFDADAAVTEAEPSLEKAGDASAAVLQLVQHSLRPMYQDQDQAYRATALVAGYFAWVQHLLVILTSFSPAAANEGFSLRTLLRAQWAVQFDLAYPLPHDAATKQLKDDLGELADEFRNPLLHGGGGRFADGVMVEWAPGHKIMAVNPDALTDQYMLLQPALTHEQVVHLLNLVDRIDHGFAQHPFYGWAARGLPADFRPDAVRRALMARAHGGATAETAAASDALDDGWG